MTDSLRLLQWNARSIRNKNVWLSQALFIDADVLCIQETFLLPQDNFHLSRKIIYRNDRVSNNRGGGTLIAVNNTIPSRLLSLPDFPSSDTEIQAVELSFPSRALMIVNLYSPSGSFTQAWLDSLFNFLKPPFLITGDFNIRSRILGSDIDVPASTPFFDWILQNKLSIINTSTPTCISSIQHPSLLDLSITSPDLYFSTTYSVIPDPYESDHCPIVLTCNFRITRQINSRFIINWKSLQEDLKSQIQYHSSDFESVCTRLLAQHSTVKHVPTYPLTPWWNKRCAYLLGQKRKYLRLAKRFISPSYWIQYKSLSAQLRRYIKELKLKYWDTVCAESGTSCNFYRIFKCLSQRNNQNNQQHLIIKVGNNFLSDPMSQAYHFGNYYSREIFPRCIPLDYSGCENSIFTHCFTYPELKFALEKTRNTAPGADNIPASLIKTICSVAPDLLLKFFNSIKGSCDPPSSWKVAKIIPILKPTKNAGDLNSYRPISLTSTICKIYERLLLQRLLKFSFNVNLFPARYLGFIPYRNCNVAHTILYQDILSARESGDFIVCVAIDLSSAYDNVWIDGLMYKLLKYGICGKTALFIQNLLQDRKFFVSWRGNKSPFFNVHKGLPQGSVLSPFLFNIYMLDFQSILPSGTKYLIFADDILIYYSGKSLDRVLDQLQLALAKISDWCSEWGMQISLHKSAIINFSKKRLNVPVSLQIFNQDIPVVQHLKFLGVYFSANFTFVFHFQHVVKKCLKKIGVLKSLAAPRWGTRSCHLIAVVNSIIRSVLEYGSAVTFSSPPTSIQKLEVCYNAAIRFALGLPLWTPIEILLRTAGVTSISLRLQAAAKKFYIRQFALGEYSPLHKYYYINHHTRFKNKTSLFLSFQNLFQQCGVFRNNIIKFKYPINLSEFSNISFFIDSLDFQKTKNAVEIRAFFRDFINNIDNDIRIIATDASKKDNKMGIAAYDYRSNISFVSQINSINSVFTGEGLAIWLALQKFCSFDHIYIFSDSMSVLKALHSYKSSSSLIVHFLRNLIGKVQSCVRSISFIWIPAHTGLPLNETADKLAKLATDAPETVSFVSPEDLIGKILKTQKFDLEQKWTQSKYYSKFQYLPIFQNKFLKHVPNRKFDVLLARLFTQTLPLNSVLNKCNKSPTPLCGFCQQPETHDHFIFECIAFDDARDSLRQSFGVSVLSFPWLCYMDNLFAKKLQSLCKYFQDTQRF